MIAPSTSPDPGLDLPPALAPQARYWRGQWHRWRYEMAEAVTVYNQALELFRAVGDRLGEANTLKAIGDVATGQEEWARLRRFYEQALQLYQAIGDRYSIDRAYYTVGNWHAVQDQRAEAAACYRQAIEIFAAIGLDYLNEQILLPRLRAVTGAE